MLVAGETSGDMHAAELVAALKTMPYNFEISGMGLDGMRAAGVRLLVDASGLATIGLAETFKNVAGLYAAWRRIKKNLELEKPDLLIVVDYPEFNLRLAKEAHRLGIKVLYYISPKIWAWNPGRIKAIRSCVSAMAVILPHEEALYRKAEVPVRYVGHPLLDQYEPPSIRKPQKTGKNILLLPGSRHSEIKRMLPLLCDAACAIARQTDKVRFSLLRAPDISELAIKALLQEKAFL